MKTHFLRAEWNNLIMANYVVPKELLLPHIPYKTALDFYEGNAYVSLVGFMFLNTKVLGLSIPMHVNFEEVNLRFYIKYNDHGNWKKGVVFIKEIVPRKAISFIANRIYGENYETMNMKHYHHDNGESLEAGYEWEYKNKWNKLSAKTNKRSTPISKASSEEFIADHYWGYTKYSETKTYEYEVEHPVWETLKVINYSVDCDFGKLYGDEFTFLINEKPKSVFMTKGSEIRVHHKKMLE
ncbi:MAG: DUF2071 domain-containing protein [Bacteroidota bacterium]|nr:DUF2071 domain-containing protein [Bacteroidota bacterium]